MKERRVRCKQCGERFTVLRFERERTSAYCDLCREDRKREQARERMRAMRARLTKHIHRCLPPLPASLRAESGVFAYPHQGAVPRPG